MYIFRSTLFTSLLLLFTFRIPAGLSNWMETSSLSSLRQVEFHNRHQQYIQSNLQPSAPNSSFLHGYYYYLFMIIGLFRGVLAGSEEMAPWPSIGSSLTFRQDRIRSSEFRLSQQRRQRDTKKTRPQETIDHRFLSSCRNTISEQIRKFAVICNSVITKSFLQLGDCSLTRPVKTFKNSYHKNLSSYQIDNLPDNYLVRQLFMIIFSEF